LKPPFAVPWHQLTRLSTTAESNTEALSLLQELLNIVECKIEYRQTVDIPPNSHTIRLLHLRSLTIQQEDAVRNVHDSHIVLKYLETPLLKRLTTHNAGSTESVLALLARSGCAESLTFLHIRCAHPLPLPPTHHYYPPPPGYAAPH
jgi:hypothetical protein